MTLSRDLTTLHIFSPHQHIIKRKPLASIKACFPACLCGFEWVSHTTITSRRNFIVFHWNQKKMSEKGKSRYKILQMNFLFLDFRLLLFFFITMTCCVEIAEKVYSGSIFIGSGRVKKISKISAALYMRERN